MSALYDRGVVTEDSRRQITVDGLQFELVVTDSAILVHGIMPEGGAAKPKRKGSAGDKDVDRNDGKRRALVDGRHASGHTTGMPAAGASARGMGEGEGGVRKVQLVECSITTEQSGKQLVSVDDFMYSNGSNGTDYYAYASEVARQHGRTLAGIVMSVLKEARKDGRSITLAQDGWLGKRPEMDTIHSSDVSDAADRIIERRATVSEEDAGEDHVPPKGTVEDPAEVYVTNRYHRLYPNNEVTFDAYLADAATYGWYGAWIKGTVEMAKMQDTKAAMFRNIVIH